MKKKKRKRVLRSVLRSLKIPQTVSQIDPRSCTNVLTGKILMGVRYGKSVFQ